MSVRAPEAREREPFNSTKISPSRLNSFVTCGVAFKLTYLDRVPPQRSGSAALFGTVCHNALEEWAPDRKQEKTLVQLVREAWVKATEGTVVAEFLALYGPLSIEAIKKEHEIREAWAARGMESKQPRRTKEWKGSRVGREIADLMREWAPKLDAGSYWRFNEYDPLPALYDESLVIAKRYQHRFGHLPNALHTEFKFDEPWRGFTLNGFIDEIEALVNPDTGELSGIGVLDYKSYAKEPAEMKDWRQVTIYDAAVRSLNGRGAIPLPVSLDEVPLYVGVDYLRWTDKWVYPKGHPKAGQPHPPRKWWKVGSGDYDRLEAELKMYRVATENGIFLPAQKGANPDFCDFPEQCCLQNCKAAGGDFEAVEVVLCW